MVDVRSGARAVPPGAPTESNVPESSSAARGPAPVGPARSPGAEGPPSESPLLQLPSELAPELTLANLRAPAGVSARICGTSVGFPASSRPTKVMYAVRTSRAGRASGPLLDIAARIPMLRSEV